MYHCCLLCTSYIESVFQFDTIFANLPLLMYLSRFKCSESYLYSLLFVSCYYRTSWVLCYILCRNWRKTHLMNGKTSEGLVHGKTLNHPKTNRGWASPKSHETYWIPKGGGEVLDEDRTITIFHFMHIISQSVQVISSGFPNASNNKHAPTVPRNVFRLFTRWALMKRGY